MQKHFTHIELPETERGVEGEVGEVGSCRRYQGDKKCEAVRDNRPRARFNLLARPSGVEDDGRLGWT